MNNQSLSWASITKQVRGEVATSAKKEAEAARKVLERNRDELLQSQRDLRAAQVPAYDFE